MTGVPGIARRRVALGLGLAPLLSSAARGQRRSYPERAIRLVVGWPPGGSADTAARLLADPWSRRVGQPVVVENRPGASGRIGALQVAQAEPDGYTALFAAPSEMTIATATTLSLPYDVFKSFQPVTQVVTGAMMLVSDAKFAPNTVAELVAYGKSNPGRLAFASYGNNTSNHIYGAHFSHLAGFSALHVPYKGGAPAWQDMAGGQIQFIFDNAAVVMPQVRAGRMKALAVLSPERIRLAPDVPTMKEAGYPEIGFPVWQGVFVPARTPPAIVQALHDDIAAVLATPELAKALEDRGSPAAPSTPLEFERVLRHEATTLKDVVRRVGLKLE